MRVYEAPDCASVPSLLSFQAIVVSKGSYSDWSTLELVSLWELDRRFRYCRRCGRLSECSSVFEINISKNARVSFPLFVCCVHVASAALWNVTLRSSAKTCRHVVVKVRNWLFARRPTRVSAHMGTWHEPRKCVDNVRNGIIIQPDNQPRNCTGSYRDDVTNQPRKHLHIHDVTVAIREGQIPKKALNVYCMHIFPNLFRIVMCK